MKYYIIFSRLNNTILINNYSVVWIKLKKNSIISNYFYFSHILIFIIMHTWWCLGDVYVNTIIVLAIKQTKYNQEHKRLYIFRTNQL